MATTASAAQLVPDVVTSWVVELDPELAELQLREGNASAGFASFEGSTVLFSGVLFNRTELACQVDVEEEVSDAELVARVYARRRDGIAQALNGTYALLIRNPDREEVLAVRDRMGLHPLFYAQADGRTFFSDSIETLVRLPGISRALNRRVLALHVWPAWWIEDKDETYYESVRRVIAGTVLTFRRGAREVRRYWNPAPPGRQVDWVDDDEAMERFEATLSEAVTRCLLRGSTALCLSGGLDSISIASFATDIAAQEGFPTPRALSVEFPDPDNTGEAAIQRRVAAHLGMPQTMLTLHEALGGQGLLPRALEVTRTWPVPLLGIFSPAYFTLIEEAKRDGRTVIMTGAGGDNWLSVALELAGDLVGRLDLVGLVRLWYTNQRSYRTSRALLLRRILWKYGVRNVLISGEQRLLRRLAPPLLRAQSTRQVERSMPAWLASDRRLRADLVELTTSRKLDELKPLPGGFYVNEIRRSLDHPILAVDLEEAFEKGTRLGVEIRMPYFDADLVDLLCRIHPRVLTKGDRSKSLVRESMGSRLAGLGIERQKKITTGNFWPKKLEEATACWKDFDGVPALGELGIVDAAAVRTWIDEMLAERRRAAVPFVWELLDHEAWVRPRL
jgi:asparagine synthase (glutamine-hydrolysing)